MATHNTHNSNVAALKRIAGLCLSGEATANLLMIYEFLNNFGDTLGFDMDSLPSLDALQAGLLNEVDYEEELLSVVIHLVSNFINLLCEPSSGINRPFIL